MPEVIDYDKRSLWRNIFDPGAWGNLLSGVGDIAGEAATTWEQLEKFKKVPTEPPPPYDPNLSVSDFAFTPNVKLILIGCGLLVVAWMLKK